MNEAGNRVTIPLEEFQKGGRLCLPVGEYLLEETLVIDIPCLRLSGEIWNYSADPNGVFESQYGTKLRMMRNDIPAIMISENNVLGGNVVEHIGIRGNIAGMDTRMMFHYESPKESSGLYFGSQRVDQAEFQKISFGGLACGVCAAENSEIDACTFEKLNMDGCCIGVYFSPRASYYTTFRNCIMADTPSYGFLLNGEGKKIHHADLDGIYFVRNGGAFSEHCRYPRAAVCIYQASGCSVRNCVFDFPGTYWHYEDDAKENEERRIYKSEVPALWVEGNRNLVQENRFSHSSSDTIVIHGDDNIIMNNVIDSNVVLCGKRNVLSGNVFTTEEARIVLAEGAEDTRLIGVEKERIQKI